MESFLQIERFMIRMTKECDISEIQEQVKTLDPVKYIIGSELTRQGKRHFHVYLEVQKKIEDVKNAIRKMGYTGNKEWSIKPCDNNVKVKRYVVKDGDFVYSPNIDKKIIDGWVLSSHKKIKDGYNDEIEELIEKYLKNENGFKSEKALGTSKIQIQIKYGIPPSRNEHIKFINYWMCKKDIKKCAELHDEWLRVWN